MTKGAIWYNIQSSTKEKQPKNIVFDRLNNNLREIRGNKWKNVKGREITTKTKYSIKEPKRPY